MSTIRLPRVRGSRLSVWLLPGRQRRTRDEVIEALDVRASRSRRSAFWTMLTLSAVIATAGVVADSTATVIGAMIIAPLATPIMGIALSLVIRNRSLNRRSLRLVGLGMLLVVAVGVIGALFLPGTFDLLGNSQITSRTSPTLVDLVAAIATGFAGALGIARRDVSDVLPGVAIAISLVPPLAVVGVCLGQGAVSAAVGAFILFVSNVLAMILAGMAMFALSYQSPRAERTGSNRRAYATLAVLVTAVVVVLAANTLVVLAHGTIRHRATAAAESWLSGVPGAEVKEVTVVADSVVIDVLSPDKLPPSSELRRLLSGQIPASFDIVIESTRGERVDVGILEGT